MRFIDEAVIEISSGDGGNGCLSFRREKFIPKGGPDGGDGGKGGNINFIAKESLHTLQDFKLKRKYKAQNGRQGKGKNMHGKDGEDTILEVPLGTILINDETDELLCDLTKSNQVYTAVYTWFDLVRSQRSSSVSSLIKMVPKGTSRIVSSPSFPCIFLPFPCRPF